MKLKLPIDLNFGRKKKAPKLVSGNGATINNQAEVPERVEGAMRNLHPLEEQVIKYIFFDCKNSPHSIKEAAQKFEITTKEVEAIYAQGLRELRGGCSKGFPPVSWN